MSHSSFRGSLGGNRWKSWSVPIQPIIYCKRLGKRIHSVARALILAEEGDPDQSVSAIVESGLMAR